MNIEERDIEDRDLNKTRVEAPVDPTTTPAPLEDQIKIPSTDSLEDDIIRNDTIPETNSNTPGSNGAFPVGAFDTSKDF